jgi:hypothetical protein
MRFQSFRDFEDGEFLGALGFDIVIHRRFLGELFLPSGHLVACDPLFALDTEAFSVSLPAGAYPMHLILAELRDELRVAYAVVDVQDGQAQRWEIAELPPLPGSDVLDRFEEVGYAVDSTLGAFLDLETAMDLLNYQQIVLPDEDDFERNLWGQIRRRRRHGVGFASLELRRDLKIPVQDQRNLIAFDAGFGPGYYPTYFGFDGDGSLCRVVTDFDVLDLRFPSFPMS